MLYTPIVPADDTPADASPNLQTLMNLSENPDSRPAVDRAAPSDTIRIPVIEEQLQVSKQVIETGKVTLTKIVQEDDVPVSLPASYDNYLIERVAIDQYVNAPPAPRQEGNTTIYPVLREVSVVQTRLLLVEEIHVTLQHTEATELTMVRLRSETVEVQRTASPISPERPA